MVVAELREELDAGLSRVAETSGRASWMSATNLLIGH